MAQRSSRHTPLRPDAVAHQVDFYLTADDFARLGELAEQTGVVYPDGKPKLAELTRVLLVSQVWGERSVRIRAGIAVYCNSILSLSGQLAQSLSGLRPTVAKLLGIKWTPGPPKPVRTRNPNRTPSHVVSVILDDLLRDRLTLQLQASIPKLQEDRVLPENLALARPAPGATFTRLLVLDAINRPGDHYDVIKGYLIGRSKVDAQLASVIEAQQNALKQALLDI